MLRREREREWDKKVRGEKRERYAVREEKRERSSKGERERCKENDTQRERERERDWKKREEERIRGDHRWWHIKRTQNGNRKIIT